jgi:hypothetical protein
MIVPDGCRWGEKHHRRAEALWLVVRARSSVYPGFECRVDDYEIVRSGQSLGDHYEGQFEGQIGASECLSEPVPACVS